MSHTRKNYGWRPARKLKPWPNRPLMWSEIQHLFPVTMGPCEAIRHTAEKVKQMGLMSCSNKDLTDQEIQNIKKGHLED